METSTFIRDGEAQANPHVQPFPDRLDVRPQYSSTEPLLGSAHHLPLSAALRLTAAVGFATTQYSCWRGLTINLSKLDAPQSVECTLRALMDHIRHWQQRVGAPPYWCWVREQGALLGDHVHILVAAPEGLGRVLSANISRWLRGSSIRGDLPRGTLHTRPTTPSGWLAYVCKTLSPADTATLRELTGARVSTEKPGGAIIGQRIGISRGLGPKARATASA